MEVGGQEGGGLALRHDQLPGLDVERLGEDGEVEHEVVQRGDAVGDREGEGVGRLVGDALDVVEAVLVDDRLVEHGHLERARRVADH